MTKIFIAGSISIKHLDLKVKERIDNIIDAKHTVLVGDADGADCSIQTHLSQSGKERRRLRRVASLEHVSSAWMSYRFARRKSTTSWSIWR